MIITKPIKFGVGIGQTGANKSRPADDGNIGVEYRYKAQYVLTKPEAVSPPPYTGWTGSVS